MADKRYVDLESGLSRVRGNKKLFHRMLGLFVNSEEFGKLEEAVSAGDLKAAGDVAHAIKGMSGNLSLTLMFELSAELMNQYRQGNDDRALLDRYRQALEDTLSQVKQLMEELEKEL